jgi:hypothetical protein
MPDNELEVFAYFTEDEATDLELDYLSYAIFARRKWHWVERFNEVSGHAAVQSDIDGWIKQLSIYDLDTMRSEAADFFHNAATRYMTNDVAKARIQGKDDAIVASLAEIKTKISSINNIWSQIIVAIIAAIITPVALGSTFFFWHQYEQYMPSPFRIFQDSSATNPPSAPPPSPAPPR